MAVQTGLIVLPHGGERIEAYHEMAWVSLFLRTPDTPTVTDVAIGLIEENLALEPETPLYNPAVVADWTHFRQIVREHLKGSVTDDYLWRLVRLAGLSQAQATAMLADAFVSLVGDCGSDTFWSASSVSETGPSLR